MNKAPQTPILDSADPRTTNPGGRGLVTVRFRTRVISRLTHGHTALMGTDTPGLCVKIKKSPKVRRL